VSPAEVFEAARCAMVLRVLRYLFELASPTAARCVPDVREVRP
jgi:hypothetical protein